MIAQALVAATRELAQTGDTARLDAELLMAHALGITRSDLILHHLHDAVPAAFAALVERRNAGEPLGYIVGTQQFWGLDLMVGPAVLIPRSDTETLIAVAQQRLRDRPPARVIDLGTGSGALLLAALSIWPNAQGIGIDRSDAALDVARANAGRLGLDIRTRMIAADWTRDNWSDGLGRSDLVLANPPYVETGATLDRSVVAYEPHGALFAGNDGLDDYRVLLPQLTGLLAPAGIALIEIGWTQGPAVTQLAKAAGLTAQIHPDLAGRPRVVEISAQPSDIQ